jgi:hypothetical protein
MRRAVLRSLAPLALAAAPASAATFVNAVVPGTYTMGDVFIASPTLYNNPAAAFGKPNPIVGSGFFAGAVSPFNAHYENTDLVAIGRGGTITLAFAAPVPVGPGREIGVHTSASLNDASYPSATAGSPAQTFANLEYGADRTAVVEVAQTAGNFVSLGRVKFDVPSNFYRDSNDAYLFQGSASEADFGRPFAGNLASFDGKTFPQMLTLLDGSAGGTWLDVPENVGLTAVNFIRFSDPQWVLANGTIADTRTSIFDPTYVKKGDLFIDAVSAVPEPGALAPIAMFGIALGIRGRRGRGA